MTPVWLPERVAEAFLLPRIGADRGLGPFEALGALDGDMKLVAVVAIHDWQPEYTTCQISAAGDDSRWASRGIIGAALGHVFGPKGCTAAHALCEATNRTARRYWKAIGAIETEVPHGRGLNRPEIVHTLTAPAWAASRFNRSRAHG